MISLFEELQSSVRAGPSYGPVGGCRLKSGLFNRYVIVGISEVFGHNHADLQSVTPALAHDRSVNYSTARRPNRRGFKFEKNLRKGCDSFEEKTSRLRSPPYQEQPLSSGVGLPPLSRATHIKRGWLAGSREGYQASRATPSCDPVPISSRKDSSRKLTRLGMVVGPCMPFTQLGPPRPPRTPPARFRVVSDSR